MRLRIEVTAEDIAAGVRGKCRACPIGLAMQRAGAPAPYVTFDLLYWDLAGKFDGRPLRLREMATARHGITPKSCERFMVDFDDGEPVAPFSFDLDLGFPEAP